MAHLPANLIPEGMAHVTALVDGLAQRPNVSVNTLNNLQTFTAYSRTYWIPLADVFSVHGKPVRTNNTCENFHLYAGRKLGHRSNIYKFLGNITIFTDNGAKNLQRPQQTSSGALFSFKEFIYLLLKSNNGAEWAFFFH